VSCKTLPRGRENNGSACLKFIFLVRRGKKTRRFQWVKNKNNQGGYRRNVWDQLKEGGVVLSALIRGGGGSFKKGGLRSGFCS